MSEKKISFEELNDWVDDCYTGYVVINQNEEEIVIPYKDKLIEYISTFAHIIVNLFIDEDDDIITFSLSNNREIKLLQL